MTRRYQQRGQVRPIDTSPLPVYVRLPIDEQARWEVHLIAQNVAQFVDTPKVEKKQKRALTPDEVKQLLAASLAATHGADPAGRSGHSARCLAGDCWAHQIRDDG
jgi:integrase